MAPGDKSNFLRKPSNLAFLQSFGKTHAFSISVFENESYLFKKSVKKNSVCFVGGLKAQIDRGWMMSDISGADLGRTMMSWEDYESLG